MRILITGSHGQLGNELKRLFETGVSEIGAIPELFVDPDVDYTDADELDITSSEAVNTWFDQHDRYDLVILARTCSTTQTKLVQVSTDYVFSGKESSPRTEQDAPYPVSAYGRSKLAGEGLALAANPQTFVVRTAWLYGYVGKNFVATMRTLGAKYPEISVVDDQVGNPTSANDLAHAILCIAATENYGIYHATNEGTCSWADFAEAIMAGSNLDCKVSRVTSAQWKEMHPESASRPAYSSLVNGHLESTIGNCMRPWQEALATYLSKVERG